MMLDIFSLKRQSTFFERHVGGITQGTIPDWLRNDIRCAGVKTIKNC